MPDKSGIRILDYNAWNRQIEFKSHCHEPTVEQI